MASAETVTGLVHPGRARLDQSEHDGRHPEGAGQGAGQVESPTPAFGLDDDDPAEQPDDQPDGNVHEHHPAPRDELGEQPAGHQSGGSTGGRHRCVQADGPDPLWSFGEHRGEEGEGRRSGHGGTDPLGRPGGQEHPSHRGQTSDEGAHGENGYPHQERPSTSEQVAGPGAEQQQAAEGEDVGVEYPRQGAAREAQALLDVWQGHVDDGGVEDDHQLGREDHEEEDRGVARGDDGACPGRPPEAGRSAPGRAPLRDSEGID